MAKLLLRGLGDKFVVSIARTALLERHSGNLDVARIYFFPRLALLPNLLLCFNSDAGHEFNLFVEVGGGDSNLVARAAVVFELCATGKLRLQGALTLLLIIPGEISHRDLLVLQARCQIGLKEIKVSCDG